MHSRLRRAFFKDRGATATDHGVESPCTHRLSDADATRLFDRALHGAAPAGAQASFEAHMLMEMARMSTEDGLVMQLHPGVLRDHDPMLHERFGPNVGADIPVAAEFTHNLRALLNTYGDAEDFTLVVFTLDESTYARELAPLAGHYPAMRLGPPWWFHDSIEGMRRYRERTTETAGIYNTAGFNDDTRAFCSIPARHDLSRRVDANWLARPRRRAPDLTSGGAPDGSGACLRPRPRDLQAGRCRPPRCLAQCLGSPGWPCASPGSRSSPPRAGAGWRPRSTRSGSPTTSTRRTR